MQTAEEFYDGLAADYDAMTRFADRLARQKQVLAAILERFPATRAADMGCGTGVHAVALAGLGVRTTGLDVSAAMLDRAREHAAAEGADIRFLQGDFLSDIPGDPVDLILCLGNSLPHLASREELCAVLAHWRAQLARGGRVLIQLLNYDRVLARGERIVNIRREGGRSTIRFYDFLSDGLQFNILTVFDAETPITHELRSTRLMPFTAADIMTATTEAGFAGTALHGSLGLTPLTEDSSDLVAILTGTTTDA